MLKDIWNKFKTLNKKNITIRRADKQQDITGLSPRQIKSILLSDDFNRLIPLYHFMLERDLHLSSEINKRKMGIVSMPYTLTCEDKNIKSFVTAWCENINIHSLIMELSSAMAYGFSCIDFKWEVGNIDNKDYFIPTSFNQLNQRFIYGDDEIENLQAPIEYLYINQDSDKIYIKNIDTKKVLTHFHKIDTGNITDYAILKKVAWFVALKHMIISHNMNYFDTLAVPPLIIKTDKSDDEDALEEIMTQALSLRSNSVGVFGKDDLVELLSSKSSSVNFLSFIDKIDMQISTFINGNTLTSSSDGKGSYALGKVHRDTSDMYSNFDANLISNTISRFINKIISINFQNPKPCQFTISKPKDKDLKNLSDVYKNITDMGYEIPPTHIEEIFNIKGIVKKVVITTDNNNQYFRHKEKNKQTFSKNLDHLDDELEKFNDSLKPIAIDVNKHLIDILEKAKSYDEAYELIAKNYKDNNLLLLEQQLSKVIANSEMIGLGDA